jgi:hypothetical protein
MAPKELQNHKELVNLMTQKIDQLQHINRDLNYEKINKCLHQENNYAMKFQICISRSTGGVNYLGIHTIRQNPVL